MRKWLKYLTRSHSHLLAVRLHFDFKAKLNITGSLTTSDAPVFCRNFAQHDFYIIRGNTVLRQVAYN